MHDSSCSIGHAYGPATMQGSFSAKLYRMRYFVLRLMCTYTCVCVHYSEDEVAIDSCTKWNR